MGGPGGPVDPFGPMMGGTDTYVEPIYFFDDPSLYTNFFEPVSFEFEEEGGGEVSGSGSGSGNTFNWY